MKTTSSNQRNLTAVLAFTLSAIALPFSTLRAHEGENHNHGAPAPEAGSSAEAWTNAQASLKAIRTAAAAKEHEPIHNEQEKLAASLKLLQEKGIAGTDKARLDGAIKNAIAASEKVHTAADAKDFAKVDSSLKTLEPTMALVEKQVSAPAK